MQKSLFTSLRQDWRTPKKFYEELNKEFGFDCDPCIVNKGELHPVDMLGSSWGGGNLLCESSLFRYCPMGKESLPRMAERQNHSSSDTFAHRYDLVARICHESNRDTLCKGEAAF